jgi:hypothetical protein
LKESEKLIFSTYKCPSSFTENLIEVKPLTQESIEEMGKRNQLFYQENSAQPNKKLKIKILLKK